MEFIADPKMFREKMLEIESLIERDVGLPKQVFQREFTEFMVIDFDEIFVDLSQRINAVLEELREVEWTFAVIKPDPHSFFYEHFNKYPFFDVTRTDSFEDSDSLMWKPFGVNPADSIDTIAENIVVYPKSRTWAIYGDKDFEIGIVAFKGEGVMNTFIAAYGSDRLFTMGEAIPNLLEITYKDHVVPEKIRSTLLENYG